MMNSRFGFAFLLFWHFGGTLCAQQIDTVNSYVAFEIKKLMIHPVHGTFRGMRGEIQFDPANTGDSFFSVCIDAATIDTRQEGRDNHLRSDEFFDVMNHPLVCFTSDSIATQEKGYKTYGQLKIAGIARQAEIIFDYQENEFHGTLIVNRFDYNLGVKSFNNSIAIGTYAEVSIHAYILP